MHLPKDTILRLKPSIFAGSIAACTLPRLLYKQAHGSLHIVFFYIYLYLSITPPFIKMLFSLQKLFSILALVAPGLLSPVQQDPLQLTCTSNAGTISGYDLTQDVEYGYKGPGVYHITSLADHYNLVVGDTGTGEGVPVVMWYIL